MLPLFIPAKNPARKQLSAVGAAILNVQFLIGVVAVNIVTESHVHAHIIKVRIFVVPVMLMLIISYFQTTGS